MDIVAMSCSTAEGNLRRIVGNYEACRVLAWAIRLKKNDRGMYERMRRRKVSGAWAHKKEARPAPAGFVILDLRST